MKDLMSKAFALGLGLAQSTKEQAEKLAQELTTRGEMSKSDSIEFINGLIERGQETRAGIENTIRDRVKQLASDMNLASREEVERLEERIARLEASLTSANEASDNP